MICYRNFILKTFWVSFDVRNEFVHKDLINNPNSQQQQSLIYVFSQTLNQIIQIHVPGKNPYSAQIKPSEFGIFDFCMDSFPCDDS